MNFPVPLTIVLTAAAATLIASSWLHSSTARSEQRIHDLQAALDVQTDVVAPFLRTFHLGSGMSVHAATFPAFLDEQVQSGKISATDAKAVLAALSAAGQGEPVLTSRGWIMSAIAKGN
ncbi:hypothetical protein DB345_10270 [Spartobacteria bacterium LR76]|nr:hypothetical protein DB345_10270 [Spartobacteria bacterium LR76]